MYEWKAKPRMILWACEGWSDSAHFAHVRRHFFAWRDPNKESLESTAKLGGLKTRYSEQKTLVSEMKSKLCYLQLQPPLRKWKWHRNNSNKQRNRTIIFLTLEGLTKFVACDILKLTHLCRMDSSTITFWTGPFQIERVSCWFLFMPCFIEIPVFNANNIKPDQTPQSAASDLGLHCLLISLLWDAVHT